MPGKSDAIVLTLLAVFLVWAFLAVPATATVAWSDNFNDGNYDGWTILQGSFITPSGPRYYLSGGSSSPDWIHHPSTQIVGTWLFEMYEDGIIEDELEVLFMATGTNYTNFEGYAVDLFYGIDTYGITLERWNYSSTFDRSARFPIISYDIYGPEMNLPTPGWRIYNVTRTGDGNIYVSRNDELIITCTPALEESFFGFTNTINSSDKFIVRAWGNASIDTIVVGTDLPPIIPFETTTTTSTSTTSTNTNTWTSGQTGTTDNPPNLLQYLLIIGAGGAAIVILVVVIFVFKKGR